jgi:hypothetical protein
MKSLDTAVYIPASYFEKLQVRIRPVDQMTNTLHHSQLPGVQCEDIKPWLNQQHFPPTTFPNASLIRAYMS